jgi:thiol peroxidase
MQERKDEVTLAGNPITLIGPRIKVGQKAPDFKLVGDGFKPGSLSTLKTKVKLISVTFSLETPICDEQTRTFEEMIAQHPSALGYSISMDLPFTLGRYAKEHSIAKLKLLTDYQEAAFGSAYGVLIKENRLLARAVFILDKNNNVAYTEYVKDITHQPDFKAALKALGKLTV